MAAANEYSYKKIADLREGMTTHVYGIVKYFKKPSETKSGLYCMSMGIVDESSNVGQLFHCMLFSKDKNVFPLKATVGDVVRFHRLRVTTFNGCLQGKMSSGFSWLLVRGSYKEHSHGHCTFTEKDKNRIAELKKWASESNDLTDCIKRNNKVSISLSQIKPEDAWINTVVQVVSVNQSVTDPNCAMIIAWDGSKPSCASYNYCQPGEPTEEPPSELVERSHGSTVDIHVYDDHRPEALALSPGQFIIVSNLHVRLIDLASQHTLQGNLFIPEQFSANPTFIGLIIHSGRSYDRGITVLDETEPEAVTLKNRIQGFLETKILRDRADKRRQSDLNQSSCHTVSKKPRSGEETEDETSTEGGILANNDNGSHQSTAEVVHLQIPDTSRISEAKSKPDFSQSMPDTSRISEAKRKPDFSQSMPGTSRISEAKSKPDFSQSMPGTSRISEAKSKPDFSQSMPGTSRISEAKSKPDFSQSMPGTSRISEAKSKPDFSQSMPDTSRISEAKSKPDFSQSMRLQLDIRDRMDELKGIFSSEKSAEEEQDCSFNLADFDQPFTQTQGATQTIESQNQASSVLELEHTSSSSKNEHVRKRCSKPSSSQIALTPHSNLNRSINVKMNAEAVQEDKSLRNVTTPVHKVPNTSTAISSINATPGKSYTEIENILSSEEVPKKFYCKVKISDFKPKTAVESVYISCCKCKEAKNLTILPEEAAYVSRKVCCARCLQVLNEEYRFVAVLKDEKSLINVDLAGKDAEVFFCDLKAKQVRKSKRDREKLEKIINALVVEDPLNQDSQTIDCCIETYYKESHIQSKTISYRIVQTRLPAVFLQ